VHPAPLRVLAGLDMPAALFEMGYLTNAEQEKGLATEDVRSLWVQAVYDAVSQFATGPAPAPVPAAPAARERR
jgi:N-acetylmuramoyl-L-alanine amidase